MNKPITHELKIYKEYADAIINGEKTFEIRLNDRRYKVGDIIKFTQVSDGRPILNHPITKKEYKITYMLEGWGLKDNWCVFSIKEIKENENTLSSIITKEAADNGDK